jgi:acetyl esterase/lipase
MKNHVLGRSLSFVLPLASILLFASQEMKGQTPEKQTPDKSIPLWSASAPLSSGDAPTDKPTLDIYLPAQNPTGTGVLVIPGGGYHYLAAPEGKPVALWLQAHGVAAFVLSYRVAPYHYPAEMLDAMRAMRLVRSNAANYRVSPNRIGVWGFSAGGHLASYLMTQWQNDIGTTQDSIDAISARPDFGILSYPVISMRPEYAHRGSHDSLLGTGAIAEQESQLSSELHVQADSPPAFIVATSDDGVVPVMNSVMFYQAYVQQHLPVEMHLFEHGPHGMVLAEKLSGASAWPDLLATWMTRHHWMSQ